MTLRRSISSYGICSVHYDATYINKSAQCEKSLNSKQDIEISTLS